MAGPQKEDVMKRIYNKINSVIGAGDQLFTMTYPGQPLNYRRFVYDTDGRNSVLTKPYTVAEAEFRIADQLFNPVAITAGTNGKKLSTVYNLLINNYVPKVDELAPFFRDRAGLSKFLLQPSGEIDEQGHPISRMKLTNMLYEKYLTAKNEWEKEKNAKFDRMKADSRLDDYAKWMSSEGLVREEQLNNLYNDVVVRGHLHEVMTLLGYINSSSTAEELEAVKQRMRHSQRLSLDESMLVYPVQFQPSNWFMAMTPNLQPKDLTMARNVLSDQLREKRKLLRKTKSKLSEIELLSISRTKISQIEDEVREGRKKLEEAESELMERYGDGVITAVKTYLNYKSIASEMAFDAYVDQYTGGGFSMLKTEMSDLGLLPDGLNTSKKIIDTVTEATEAVINTYKANNKVLSQQRELLELSAKAANAKSHEMSSEKIRLKDRIEDLEADVKYLSDLTAGTHGEVAKEKVRIDKINRLLDAEYKQNPSAANRAQANKKNREILRQILEWYPNVDLDKASNMSPGVHFNIDDDAHLTKIVKTQLKEELAKLPKHYDLIPKSSEEAEIDGFFNDITIKISHSETEEQIRSESESTEVHGSISLGFFSASASYSHSKASNSMESKFLSNDIEIGMRVAKVSFDRGGWFNPALFDMSKSFFHLAKLKAGAGFSKNEDKYRKAQNKLENSNDYDYMLPSFPVAMVIAKDITIKVTSEEDISTFSKEVESESMSGNAGLFCFSVSGGKSSSSMAESSFHGHDSKSFYIRIPGPQILGYYQQFVKDDESTHYSPMIKDGKEDSLLMKALHEFDLPPAEELPSIQEVTPAELDSMRKLIEKSGGGNPTEKTTESEESVPTE